MTYGTSDILLNKLQQLLWNIFILQKWEVSVTFDSIICPILKHFVFEHMKLNPLFHNSTPILIEIIDDIYNDM